MNKVLYTLAFLFICFTTVFAGSRERSMVIISLSDNSPLVVSVNGRNYNKHARSITISDLPRGRHDLRVYEYLEYRKGGGRAKLLYTGRVKIAAGTINYCEVDIRTGELRVRTADLLAVNTTTAPPRTTVATGNKVWQEGGKLSEQEMDDLQIQVAEKLTDIEKLKLVKSALNKKTFDTKQVRFMASWYAFEDSKLDFIEWAYSKTRDKTEYEKLEDIFTIERNKEDFRAYLKS